MNVKNKDKVCPALKDTYKCLQAFSCETCSFYHTNAGGSCKGCNINRKCKQFNK